MRIPFNFEPREYQLPVLRAMEGGCKRLVMVDHRRSGKDKVCLNAMVKEMLGRVGTYYYFFPTYNQGRKILWDGADRDGFRYLGHIPEELRDGEANSTEMKMRLRNGSLFQVVGTDNIDSIVGTNPVGCVFSEYSLQDPRGWDFVRPILAENGGWAMFPYTPRGKNHGWDLYEMARGNPDWYCQRLTVRDTWGRGGTMSPEVVEAERRAGMKESLIEQEFYCSFDAAVENAVFGDELRKMREEGRITRVPLVNGVPVDTYWDLGHYDATVILFVQRVRSEVRIVDYIEGRQAKMPVYVADLQRLRGERGYVYGTAYMPHDSEHEGMVDSSPADYMRGMGFDVQVVPRTPKHLQIEAGRVLMNRVWVDEGRCGKLVDALASYHFGYDDEKKILSREPMHDWASHPCDAYMQLAVAHEDANDYRPRDKYARRRRTETSWMAA